MTASSADSDFECLDEFDLECGMRWSPCQAKDRGSLALKGARRPWQGYRSSGGRATTGLALRWAHRRYLAVTGEPETAYRRLRDLAAFGGMSAASSRTPYQFGEQLGRRLPAYSESVSVIVDSYVRTRYGAKAHTYDESGVLADAWTAVRYPLLRLSLLRRSLVL